MHLGILWDLFRFSSYQNTLPTLAQETPSTIEQFIPQIGCSDRYFLSTIKPTSYQTGPTPLMYEWVVWDN